MGEKIPEVRISIDRLEIDKMNVIAFIVEVSPPRSTSFFLFLEDVVERGTVDVPGRTVATRILWDTSRVGELRFWRRWFGDWRGHCKERDLRKSGTIFSEG